MAGRKKREEIWRNYRSGPDKSAICKYCDHKYKVANVSKMCQHLLKCDKCPAIVKSQLKTESGGNSSKSIDIPVILSPSSLITQLDTTTDNISSNLSLPSTSTSTDNLQQSFEVDKLKNLTTKLAKAVYISGSPLSLVEHPLWVDFFKELQPCFELPSRKQISTTLLDRVHTEIKKEVTESLRTTSYLHLQCDGWTNVNNEGIINFIISNPSPYFVESLSTEDNRHTSSYLSEQIIKVMQAYGESKFVVLIGDNARNIQKSFELVKNKYCNIIPLNCAAHTLNLLVHDILKCEVIKAVIDMVTEVIKVIKKSQLLSLLLKKIIKEKKAGETLKLPVKTRWGSHVAALKSLKNSKASLMALAIHEAAVQLPSETKSTILDDKFWSLIEECITILELVTRPIFTLESNDCNIHNVFTIFKDIKSKLEFIMPNLSILSDEDKQTILCAVDKRTNPNTQGLALNEDEDLVAMEFITQMSQHLNINIIVDLANYKARDGFWGKRFIWDKVGEINPVTWWKGLCSTKPLSKIAIRILTAPCTSAATERSFSKHGHIHSRKRNCLTAERAAKLTFISYNWDLLHKYDCAESIKSSENEPCEEERPDDFQNLGFAGENRSPSRSPTRLSEFGIEFLNYDTIISNDNENENIVILSYNNM